jgi:hypothetical protein
LNVSHLRFHVADPWSAHPGDERRKRHVGNRKKEMLPQSNSRSAVFRNGNNTHL